MANSWLYAERLGENVIRLMLRKGEPKEDAPSFLVLGLFEFEPVRWDADSYDEEKDELTLSFKGGYSLVIPRKTRGFNGIKVLEGDEVVYEYEKIANSGELPLPSKTPRAFPLLDAPRLIPPRQGYRPSAKWEKEEGAADLYLLIVEKDHRLLHELYAKLTGTVDLMPLSAFGTWDSKYYEYTEETVEEEIRNFDKHDLPLDNFVIDTDWRRSGPKPGAGYALNKRCFPSLAKMFEKHHEDGITFMFNDHPEPVKGAVSAFDPVEVKYRRNNLIRYHKEGLDYWWYDRNWWTRLVSPWKEINPETIGFYLYEETTRDYIKMHTPEGEFPKRTLMMGNVDNIVNGAYKGIKNSASHRYGIQWTGDNWMTPFDLKQETENLILAGNSLITYINPDLTGHIGDGSDRLYLRWVQMGTFLPIFRLHSTKGNKRYRQPWFYGERAIKWTRETLKFRYRALPFMYSLAYESHVKGYPIVRPLSWVGDEERLDVGLVGDYVLYAPIVPEERIAIASKDLFKEPVRLEFYKNKNLKGKPFGKKTARSINFDWGKKEPLPGLGLTNYSARLETVIENGDKDMLLLIGSDDGCRVYLDGELVDDSWGNRGFAYDDIKVLAPHERHKLVIEYFQGTGGAALKAALREVVERPDPTSFRLPKGEWVDLFTGERKEGEKDYDAEYPLESFPLFARDGAIIPLVKDVLRTKNSSWSVMSLELFPGNGEFTLHEDDFVTEAYKHGLELNTTFKMRKDGDRLLLSVKPEGDYVPCETRELRLRVHLKDGENYRPFMDNQEIPSVIIERNPSSYPLPFEGGAPDSRILEAKIVLDPKAEKEIVFEPAF